MQENPSENNNFQTIISTWRRLSGELIQSSDFTSMSGDSQSHLFKKKEEESNLMALEKPTEPTVTSTATGTAVVTFDKALQVPSEGGTTDLKQDTLEQTQEKEESKEAAGDVKLKEDANSMNTLGNESEYNKVSDKGDNVDSVYLRPPPPHKIQSNSSPNEDEDCGIKCLYYTLQCCDCVLM